MAHVKRVWKTHQQKSCAWEFNGNILNLMASLMGFHGDIRDFMGISYVNDVFCLVKQGFFNHKNPNRWLESHPFRDGKILVDGGS